MTRFRTSILQGGGRSMKHDRRDFLQDSARLGAFALTSAALWRIEPVLAQSGPGHELATMTIVELSQLLASGKITSRQLVEQALAAIKDPQGEGARTFSLRVFDCRERLFDELTAGDFPAGKKLRKLDDGHRGEFMSWPALRENRLDAPKRCTGKCKSPQTGRVLQKISTIVLHTSSSSLQNTCPKPGHRRR